jgi:hypothetical protein
VDYDVLAHMGKANLRTPWMVSDSHRGACIIVSIHPCMDVLQKEDLDGTSQSKTEET